MPSKLYKDRFDAARQLIPKLKKYKGGKNTILLAIPRGALVIGAVLRDELNIPLDIVVTKKISAPGNEEYAIGSVGPDGSIQTNLEVISAYGIPQTYIDEEAKRLQHIIQRRYQEYRDNPIPPDLKGKIVIVIDDGIATGFTASAAIQSIRKQKPQKIILAIPVAASDSYEKLKKEVDELICLEIRDDFYAVGQFYQIFEQVDDQKAKELLNFHNSVQ